MKKIYELKFFNRKRDNKKRQSRNKNSKKKFLFEIKKCENKKKSYFD